MRNLIIRFDHCDCSMLQQVEDHAVISNYIAEINDNNAKFTCDYVTRKLVTITIYDCCYNCYQRKEQLSQAIREVTLSNCEVDELEY